MNSRTPPPGRARGAFPHPRTAGRPRAAGWRGVRRPRTGRAAGQGLVEFSLIVPVMLLLLLGMLEFGFVFDAHLNLEYASREGARTGASLADGASGVPCDTATGVDAHIVAAVERVLTSQGSPLRVDKVVEIRIFKATSTGGETSGKVNIWTYTPTAGPTIDGTAIHFAQGSVQWSACTRDNGSTPDSIGVGLHYTYDLRTPLMGLMRIAGGGNTWMKLSDKTVMALNP